jgi:hypothetical protein
MEFRNAFGQPAHGLPSGKSQQQALVRNTRFEIG